MMIHAEEELSGSVSSQYRIVSTSCCCSLVVLALTSTLHRT